MNITRLTGERRKKFIINTSIWAGMMFAGMFLGLVAVSPPYFHLPAWGWLQKGLGGIAFLLFVGGGMLLQGLRLTGQGAMGLAIEERDAQGKKTNIIWRILNMKF